MQAAAPHAAGRATSDTPGPGQTTHQFGSKRSTEVTRGACESPEFLLQLTGSEDTDAYLTAICINGPAFSKSQKSPFGRRV